MDPRVDARTGFEVWAFIPFNLAAQLRTLHKRQPVEQLTISSTARRRFAECEGSTARGRSLLIIW